MEGLGERGRPVYLLGSAAEKPIARAFGRAADPRLQQHAQDLCGRTSWDGLIDVVSGLELVLTPDTGTMHLAAMLGAPVAATFLSSAWAFETGPYGLGHTVWQAVTECAPCLESQPCPHELECLSPFSHRGLLALLSGRKAEPPPGLVKLTTAFDAVGVCYEAALGRDPWAGQRRALRGLVAEHLGLGRPQDAPAAGYADMLYQERDWMLPAPPGMQRNSEVTE